MTEKESADDALTLSVVLKTAKAFAASRLAELVGFNPRAKLPVKDIQRELAYAAVFGEMSCLERITAMLVDNRKMTRDEIEGQIHLAIVDYYGFIKKEFGGSRMQINLDKYLELRGYTGSGPASVVTDVSSS